MFLSYPHDCSVIAVGAVVLKWVVLYCYSGWCFTVKVGGALVL